MTPISPARVLVLANHDHQHLDPITARLITAAQNFNLPVDVFIAGADCQSVAHEAASLHGIENVLLAVHENLISAQAETFCALLAPLMQDQYEVLLAANNTLGRELVPRLAAQLDVCPLSDVTQIIETDLFERSIYAGAALVQVKMQEPKKLMTLRTGKFPPAAKRAEHQACAKLLNIDMAPACRSSRLIGEEFFWDQPALETAPIVIGLGGGAAKNEDFALIEALAQRLGAVIGGSKSAIDLRIVPSNVLIGQSGKTIAPNLYIALGISGAAQHLAGIRDAKTIIAINKDPEAAIFKLADYGLVGDLHDLLPQLVEAVGQAN